MLTAPTLKVVSSVHAEQAMREVADYAQVYAVLNISKSFLLRPV